MRQFTALAVATAAITLANTAPVRFNAVSLESFGDNYIIDTNNSPPGAPPTIPLQ
jgi:hypothetical protein